MFSLETSNHAYDNPCNISPPDYDLYPSLARRISNGHFHQCSEPHHKNEQVNYISMNYMTCKQQVQEKSETSSYENNVSTFSSPLTSEQNSNPHPHSLVTSNSERSYVDQSQRQLDMIEETEARN
ncbi:hypothetical protein BDF14DRAFT_1884947 [Spinellus fusiger]|nr:hypothetical protein BDF14DRAFT_1884947 [Spinellus fusiger]